MTRRLRDYQLDADEAIDEGHAGGVQRPAIILATGLGKTDVIGAQAAKRVRAGRRVLVLAHRFALLRQITDRCRAHLPDEPATVAGIVAGDLDQRNRPIVAAMAQTLRSPKRRARFEPFGPGDLVIVDEAHHAGARSYVDTMTHFGAHDETSGVDALGVTATMYQSARPGKGGMSLGDVWQKVVFERDIVWAVTHGPSDADPYVTAPVGAGASRGWLVTPQALSVVVDHLDVSQARRSGGDYAEADLGAMVAQDADQIADAWCEHARERITVGFFPTKDSAEAARGAFERRGVACEVVLGDTSDAERGDVAEGTGIYGRLARGETRVMLGLMVPTEGWDCPPVDCVLWARPTKVAGLAIQGWGRGLRPSPGKSDCLILDVVGATRALGLVMPADLLPGIEARETRPQACPRCGNYKRPVERFEIRCVCPPIVRDPLGGRVALIGPQRYEPVDLLGQAVAGASSDVLWLQTRGGVSFVPAKDKLVAILPSSKFPGGWKAGVVDRDGFGKGVPLVDGAPLDIATGCAEQWARDNVEPTYWSRSASWRRSGQAPSDGQLRAARTYGIESPERYNRAALSDLLSIRAASRRLDVRPRVR